MKRKKLDKLANLYREVDEHASLAKLHFKQVGRVMHERDRIIEVRRWRNHRKACFRLLRRARRVFGNKSMYLFDAWYNQVLIAPETSFADMVSVLPDEAPSSVPMIISPTDVYRLIFNRAQALMAVINDENSAKDDVDNAVSQLKALARAIANDRNFVYARFRYTLPDPDADIGYDLAAFSMFVTKTLERVEKANCNNQLTVSILYQ